jgi:hypothetical protein
MGLLGEVSPNVERAFYGHAEWNVEGFASRWGGLHTEAFTRVLDEGQGDDKVFAIFAIGYLEDPWAQQQMWSFVESPVRKERWASAYCLGVQHNEDALPYLKKILVDGFDLTEDMSDEEEGWYVVRRNYVAELLTSWGSATMVPDLRQSFLAVQTWREARPLTDDYLFVYQDTLAYALGHYGAIGALTGIKLSAPQHRVTMIYLALGILHAKEHYEVDINSEMISNKDLQHAVEHILENQFGLSEHERQGIVVSFWKDHERRVPAPEWCAEVDVENFSNEM